MGVQPRYDKKFLGECLFLQLNRAGSTRRAAKAERLAIHWNLKTARLVFPGWHPWPNSGVGGRQGSFPLRAGLSGFPAEISKISTACHLKMPLDAVWGMGVYGSVFFLSRAMFPNFKDRRPPPRPGLVEALFCIQSYISVDGHLFNRYKKHQSLFYDKH
jgi:hypothetical protein